MKRHGWIVGLLAAAALPLLAGDGWPQWRGPDRSGVVAAENLDLDWRDATPSEVWRVPIGDGFAGITIGSGRLYTLFAEGDTEFLGCFDPATGKEQWRKAIGEKFTDQFGDGPRSTPSLDGELVYALGAMGHLYAFDAESGEQEWHVSLTDTFGAKVSTWGYSTSPLIHGEMLLVEAGGGEGKAVAALNKKDGSTIWQAGNGVVGYSSPIAIQVNGATQFVFLLALEVTKYNLTGISEAGEVLWEHELKGFHIATPILAGDNKIFVSASNDDGCTMVQLKPGENGVTVEEAWANRVMRNTFNSCVYQNGHLYGFNNATFRSVNTADGEYQWAKRGYGKGSLILAGDHLIALSDRGKLVSAVAKPDKYEEHVNFQAMEGKSWTAPTLVDGRLYLRNLTEMVCYDLRKP